MQQIQTVAAKPMRAHCPECGSMMSARVLPSDTVARKVCERCGFVHYDNPKLLVACLLHEGDRLLWIRRATAPYLGCWALPAGFMECDETISEAACRELYEETGLRVAPEQLSLYGVTSIPQIQQVYVSLIGRLPGHGYGPTEEALEVRMLNRAEAMALELAYPPSTVPLIRQLYDALESGGPAPRPALLLEVRMQDPARCESSNGAATRRPAAGQ